MRVAAIVLVAALVSSCGSASTGSSKATGGTQGRSLATTTTTQPSTTHTGAPVARSGGPCGGLLREDVEAMFGAPVRVRPWPGILTDGITEQDQCSADDGVENVGYGYGCWLTLSTFDSAADARASFDASAKRAKQALDALKSLRSPGDGEILLSLGDASVAGVFLGGGVATILKNDRLLNLTCSPGSATREHGKVTLHRDAFASAVVKAASQL